jgi:hypothetical protein
MKLKYAWVFAAAAVLFAAFMAYLRFAPTGELPSGTATVLAVGTGEQRGARLVIVYAGDVMGSLDPCG